MSRPLLLTGIGLRAMHHAEFFEKQPDVAWVEVHTENYFGDGGRHIHFLENIRKNYPISLHGVGLSIGSADELNWQHLKQLQDLIKFINPCLISDHLSWSSINGQYLHDLLPVPYTEESLDYIVSRIQQVQEYLNQQILIENISSYIQYDISSFDEPSFLQEMAKRSGCGILLDINNIYVNAMNFNYDPYKYIDAISPHHVQEIHLGGFTTMQMNGQELLIDTHNRPVVPAVWDLYRQTIKTLGIKPTIIEWDTDLPPLETLYLEAYRAEKIIREVHAASKHSN